MIHTAFGKFKVLFITLVAKSRARSLLICPRRLLLRGLRMAGGHRRDNRAIRAHADREVKYARCEFSFTTRVCAIVRKKSHNNRPRAIVPDLNRLRTIEAQRSR